MDYFTKEQVDGFVEIFQAFDTSGDGSIDKTELSVILRALGMKYSEAEVSNTCFKSLVPSSMRFLSQIMDILAVKDHDGSGALCFSEFLGLMASEMRDVHAEDEVKDIFERACGEDGLLGQAELLAVAAEMGVQLTAAQAKSMLAEVAMDSEHPGAAASTPTAPRISQGDALKLMQGQ